MNTTETKSGFAVTGIITRSVYSTDELQREVDSWDSLTKREKLSAVDGITPIDEETVHNATTVRMHEYFVDNLDPDNSSTEANVSATWMALGDNAGGGISSSDTDLNNRVYSEQITDHADNGNELLCSTFVDSTEANGSTVDEIGLFTGDPANLANAEVFMLNHAQFSNITKDNSKTVVFDVTLIFNDA